MEIIEQKNCKFSTKDIIFVASIIGAIIVTSLCNKKEELYE